MLGVGVDEKKRALAKTGQTGIGRKWLAFIMTALMLSSRVSNVLYKVNFVIIPDEMSSYLFPLLQIQVQPLDICQYVSTGEDSICYQPL